MLHRFATRAGVETLGQLNHQLIQDERHRNRIAIPELVTRIQEAGIVLHF